MEKKYDLEDRTLEFASSVRLFLKNLPKTVANEEDGRQLIRSSGSVGANYIEANEALGTNDFKMRIKISRKEAKESKFWLNLLSVSPDQESQRVQLIQESSELVKIFTAILIKFP